MEYISEALNVLQTKYTRGALANGVTVGERGWEGRVVYANLLSLCTSAHIVLYSATLKNDFVCFWRSSAFMPFRVPEYSSWHPSPPLPESYTKRRLSKLIFILFGDIIGVLCCVCVFTYPGSRRRQTRRRISKGLKS